LSVGVLVALAVVLKELAEQAAYNWVAEVQEERMPKS